MHYAVHAARGLLDHLDLEGLRSITEALQVPWSPDRGRRWAVVLDEALPEPYGHRLYALLARLGLDYQALTLSVDERTKTWPNVERLVRFFGSAKLRRRDRILVCGGGILCDLVGAAAAGYRRGTPYWRIPTTLVAMVDLAAGVKVGFNLDESKNLFGAYYPCEMSLVDPAFLNTLPRRHVANGISEIAKVAIGTSATAFEHLELHAATLLDERFQGPTPDEREAADTAIVSALGGHIEELRPNLLETSLYRALDLGHIFSGAVEMAALPDLLHGEAVGIEIGLACTLATRPLSGTPGRELLSIRDRDRVLALMRRVGLPLWHDVLTPDLLSAAFSSALRFRDGLLRFPLPGPIGALTFVDTLEEDEWQPALERYRELAS
ncbi:MAG: 2-epi-5-epi-valiolone synthase [Solirubrobacteraceae bacterium]